jgi:hypothetical protein
MDDGLQLYDLNSETVLFWDGCHRTRAELDAVLPGLFEYAQAHSELAEITPYNLSKELVYWGLTFVACISLMTALVVIWQAGVAMIWFGTFLSTLAVGSRLVVAYVQSRQAPVIIAHNGSFEVYRRGKYRQGPIWSTNLSDIDWRLGRGGQADSRGECLLEGQYRKVVLVRRRHKGFFKKDELYGCGWNPEMKERWLALFLICSTNDSEQTAEFEVACEST